MGTLDFGRNALGLGVAAAMLASCAAGTSNPVSMTASQPQPLVSNRLARLLPRVPGVTADAARQARWGSWASRDAAKQAVYVADPSLNGYFGAICYYAPVGGTQLGCLGGGSSSTSGINFPQGTWIDGSKHLWVANGGPDASGYAGQVTEYDLPLTASSQPINTLYSTVSNPSEGAFLDYVCGDKNGTIYATVLYTDKIAVWSAGTKNGTQTSTLTDLHLSSAGSPSLADGPVACATDHAGDLFISGQFATGGSGSYDYFAELDEFVHGANGSGKSKVLQRETSDLYFPAGLAMDAQKNLAWALFNLSDSGSNVCTFVKPYKGTPTSCTSGFATGFHFTKSGANLWGGDATTYPWYHQPQAHMANEIAYPGGGLVNSTSPDGLITPVDASVNPPL
jgi:hypothetical protein